MQDDRAARPHSHGEIHEMDRSQSFHADFMLTPHPFQPRVDKSHSQSRAEVLSLVGFGGLFAAARGAEVDDHRVNVRSAFLWRVFILIYANEQSLSRLNRANF